MLCINKVDCKVAERKDGSFMAIIYDKDRMKGLSGTVYYREEFNEAV